MEYPMCTQSVKQKEFLVQLVQEKSLYFNRKFRLIRLFYFQKYINFFGSRSCPNRTKPGMEYPMCSQSVKQKEFLVQLVQEKSSYFNRKFRLIRLFYFQKYINFFGSRSCPNRTKPGMEYPMCSQSVKQKEFLVQLVQEKSSYFNRNVRLIRLFYFQKSRNFIGKELSISNQTRYGVSHVYLECKTKRIFGIACLGKKFVFQSEISTYSLILFSKIQKFYRSRSCPSRTKLGMEYPMCTQSVKQKEFLVQLVQEKSSYFNRKFRLIRLFYFQKYRNFIGSRSSPNQPKLDMEYPMCTQSVKEKEFLVQLVQEKSSYFNRKFRHIRLFYFQKYRNFIGSRSCPNRTKLGMEYPMCSQSVKQKEFLIQIVQKKTSCFNRKYRLIRLL